MVEKVEFFELGDVTDHKFRPFMLETGLVTPLKDIGECRSPEIYRIAEGANVIDIVRSSIEKVSGIQCMPVRPPFKPYSYQKKFAEKFVVCKGKRFLLAAKCRSGKTLMTYYACKTAGYRNVLVISYFSSPIEGWIGDCYKFDNGYIAIHANNDKNPGWVEQLKNAEEKGHKYFLITTAQFFDGRHKNANIIKSIVPEFDCIALDECHRGGESQSFESILKKYDCMVLEISATPFKALYNYNPEDVFIWSYEDEQKAKRNGEAWAQKAPRMVLRTKKYNRLNGTGDYGDGIANSISSVFSLNALTMEEATDFNDRDAVYDFASTTFVRGSGNRHDWILNRCKHIVVSMEYSKTCEYMAEVLRKVLDSKEWGIMVINDGKTTPKQIIEFTNTYPKTICLTVSANICGVTNPKWDTAMFLHDKPGAEDWIQIIMRGGSPDDGRQCFYGIDFSQNRAIKSIYDLFACSSNEVDESGADIVSRIGDFIDLYSYDNGHTEWSQSEIIKALTPSTDSFESTLNGVTMLTKIDEESINAITNIFNNVDGKKDNEIMIDSIINDDGIDNKSAFDISIINNNLKPKTPNVSKKLINKFNRVKANILGFIFMKRLDGVVINNTRTLIKQNEFEMYVDISSEGFEELIYSYSLLGAQSERIMNQMINKVNLMIGDAVDKPQSGHGIDSMLYLIDKLFASKDARPFPTSIINETKTNVLVD